MHIMVYVYIILALINMRLVGWLVGFYAISDLVGYLILKPVNININIYDL